MKRKILWQTFLAVLQTITGAGLVIFLAVHLFGSSMINFGETGFNAYTTHLDHSNLLIQGLIFLIAVAVFAHGLNGLRIVWRYFKKGKEVHQYLINMKYRDSFLWYVHFATGIFMGLFVTVHLIVDCFGAKEAITTAEIVKTRLQNDWYLACMILLLVCVIFHACCGTRNILIKYGLLPKHQRKIQIALLIGGLAITIFGIHNLWLFRSLP